ncbi:preprotein translocase subunit SecA [uncultured Meiothermus sp.]|jgi:preprotein translocase subunit SecA|uniref:preprotein translocase subunit SecA n=1 Tax=uncultured Meiothermus sp. TaxID=157471 RepID=UPI002634BAD1|nr:preprotein translocase subunit SecA [uncultured Meiothermus sp.]
MLAWINKLIDNNERKVARYWKTVVAPVNALEDEVSQIEDLAAEFAKLREAYQNGSDLDGLLPRAFALTRESSKRFLGLRHYDVQLIGGAVLHEGKIAEMKTGEGKTLVATLAVALNAIAGKGVHLVTVNDYLARRDADWMGPIYKGLGLTVGVVQNQSSPDERRASYLCDVTYVTNSELGFDYLRDNMSVAPEQLVLRHETPLNYAIIDEVDSILVDEARTPLIISGPAEKATDMYYRMAEIVKKLERGEKPPVGTKADPTGDYTIEEKQKAVHLTLQGIAKAEKMLGVEGLFNTENMELAHMLTQAIRAKELYFIDREYIVQEGQVIIVDEFTGRLQPGRRFGEGLHQAIEAKQGVKIERENQTLATVTYQNFFRLFEKTAGMTGTAKTEEKEFQEIYAMDVRSIPTNRPMIRRDAPDVVYRSEKGKFFAVVEEIAEKYEKGQPVLVGTISVEKSERLSAMLKEARHFLPRLEARAQLMTKSIEKQSGPEWDRLKKALERPGSMRDAELEQHESTIPAKGSIRVAWDFLKKAVHTLELIRKGIPHQVLNAKYHEKESEIVAQAGRSKTITISTNMAGRGTDIKLGGNAEYLASDLLRKEGLEPRSEWRLELFIKKLVQGAEDEALKLAPEIGVRQSVIDEIRRLRDTCAADEVRVKELGGLHIIGTERHESRRIDNQLRGRSGRQGDPGSSRFYVSFDDDLMRLFASERIVGMLDRMGFDDSEPIENQMVTRSIERAQKRVEDRHFDTRKQLLRLDEVMARQREVVYAQRRNVLLGTDESVREGALNMVEDTVDGVAANYLNAEQHPEDWDIEGLRSSLVDFIPPLKEFDFDGLRKLKPDEGSELLIEAGRAAYEAREAELNAQGPNLMRAVERFVTLQVVDNAWKEHLHNMDVLKQGIFLRGYGQRDPFQEYKLEGTRFFNEMIGGIKSEVTKFLFRLQVEVNQQPIPAPVAQGVEYSGSDAGAASPQGGFDPFTVRRQQKASTAFSGMSRAERRRLEREEKKKNKG